MSGWTWSRRVDAGLPGLSEMPPRCGPIPANRDGRIVFAGVNTMQRRLCGWREKGCYFGLVIDSLLSNDKYKRVGPSGMPLPSLQCFQPRERISPPACVGGSDCARSHLRWAAMSEHQTPKMADPRPCKPFSLAVSVKRRVWCVRYDECLDFAVERNWESFMCTSCEAFQPQLLTSDQIQLEADCCLALLYALSRRRATGRHLHGLLSYLKSERQENVYSVEFIGSY